MTANPSAEAFKLRDPGIRVAPSLLAADFGRLAEQVSTVENAGASVLHLDVMDGHFVPNISFGVPVIEALRRTTKMIFDVHLMISEPEKYSARFVQAGADHVTFHIEAAKDPDALVREIRGLGASAGISLNPSTEASAVDPVVEMIDMVLVMSVWPGFGGQAFMPGVLPKVTALRERLGPSQRLEMDGGIDLETVSRAVEAGADTLVAGSAVFGKPDPGAAYRALHERALACHDVSN